MVGLQQCIPRSPELRGAAAVCPWLPPARRSCAPLVCDVGWLHSLRWQNSVHYRIYKLGSKHETAGSCAWCPASLRSGLGHDLHLCQRGINVKLEIFALK